MARLFQHLLALLLLAIIMSCTQAFVVTPKTTSLRIQKDISPVNNFVVGPSSLLPTPSAVGSSALAATKKRNTPPKEKITDPLELVLLYMTPWRNPNSIFIYMIATVIILGKISEARH